MKRDNQVEPLVYIPCLDAKMKLVGATNIALADAAGISVHTVHRARNGHRVLLSTSRWILEAVNTRQFKRLRKD